MRRFCIIFALFFLSGCQGDDLCEEESSNFLRIRFFLAGQEDETPISIDSLLIYGLGHEDKLIYDGEKAVSLAALPLNPGNDSCGFVFRAGSLSDTLWITYSREAHFISAECGFTMFFHILEKDHSNNMFESIELINPLVSNIFDEHIKVFLSDTDPDD